MADQGLLIEINGIEYRAKDEQEKSEIERMNNKTKAIERQIISSKVYSLDRMEDEGHPPAAEDQLEPLLGKFNDRKTSQLPTAFE